MCGIMGIVSTNHVNHFIFDGLSLLQHRGQDAAGIATLYRNKFYVHKHTGMVRDVFSTEKLADLLGHVGVGHVRYQTAGTSVASESQPFYVNSPYGIMFVHNGNITNVDELRTLLDTWGRQHLNTSSDSEVLLNIFACLLRREKKPLGTHSIFSAISNIYKYVRGGFSCIAIVVGIGLVAFRDPHGIRPLAIGKRETKSGSEYIIASESVAMDITDFTLMRDLAPGEAVIVDETGNISCQMCCQETLHTPCLFEFVYFARPDSIIDGVSVYQCRVDAGKALGRHVAHKWGDKNIDVVIPIPETGRVAAQEIAKILAVDYREGFVKNRYVGRTFIMPTASGRVNSVRRKLNPIPMEFRDKNVLLVDDSIVRGTTSRKIIHMIKNLGAKSIYLCSASPPVSFPNVYGIHTPTRAELLASGRTIQQIIDYIGVDDILYLSLEDLKIAVSKSNPEITHFEDSVFSGKYITRDVDEIYLQKLENFAHMANRAEKKRLSFIADNLISKL